MLETTVAPVPGFNPPAAVGLSPAGAARVQQVLDNSISDATKTAYASDWRAFTEWCRGSGYRPVLATAEIAIAYLTSMVASVRPDGKHAYAPSTIVRRASSINAQHVAVGVAPLCADGAWHGPSKPSNEPAADASAGLPRW